MIASGSTVVPETSRLYFFTDIIQTEVNLSRMLRIKVRPDIIMSIYLYHNEAITGVRPYNAMVNCLRDGRSFKLCIVFLYKNKC